MTKSNTGSLSCLTPQTTFSLGDRD